MRGTVAAERGNGSDTGRGKSPPQTRLSFRVVPSLPTPEPPEPPPAAQLFEAGAGSFETEFEIKSVAGK